MKDEIKFRDLLQFLIHNKKIIISTIIVTTLAAISFVIYDHLTVEEPSPNTSSIERANLISEERFEEMSEWPLEFFTEPQIRQMQEYLLPHAYKLSIYVEHENHEPVANTTFMREVFRNVKVLEYIESELGEELTPAIEFAVHIENIGNSGIYELHFQRGSLEESLELGYIVMDAIDQGIIPVINNKNIYYIDQEPQVLVRDFTDYEFNGTTGGLSLRQFARDSIIFSIIGVGAGLILGLLIALLNLAADKRISALFDYAREESDKIVKLTHLYKNERGQMLEEAKININIPYRQKKIVLYDKATEDDFESLFTTFSENVAKYTDFTDIPAETESIDEVIILTKLRETNKKWYENQRVQLKGYSVPVKIIQI